MHGATCFIGAAILIVTVRKNVIGAHGMTLELITTDVDYCSAQFE